MRSHKSDIRSRNAIKTIFLGLIGLFFASDALQAQASAPLPAHDALAHTAASDVVYRWTVEDGLPINAVTDLVQDEAGFLWLATRAGLVRFDGLSFKTYNSQAFPGLPSDRLIHLYQTPDDHFWMRSEQFFLIRFDGTVFNALDTWPDFTGAQVLSSDQNSTGWLALGLRDGLAMIDADGPQRILAETINGVSEEVIWPDPARIWAVVDRELLAISIQTDGERIQQRWPLPSRTLSLLQTDQALWIGTDAGLYRLNLPIELDQSPVFQPQFGNNDINGLEQHPEGGVLVDTGDEVWRLQRASYQTAASAWQAERLYSGLTWRKQTEFLVPFANATGVHLGAGLVSVGQTEHQFEARIRAALLDRDGNTWLALHGLGLTLYRPSSLRLLGIPEGLPGENIYPIFQASDGAIWIGTLQHGAVRIDPNPAANQPFTQYQSDTLLAWTIAEFDDGIWLGGKPCKIVGQHCIDKPLEDADQISETFTADPVSLLYRDRNNKGWLGTQFGGLYEKRGERWIRSGLMANNWPITTPIRTAEESPDGALWLGTSGDGLVRIADSNLDFYTTEHGLSSNLVRDLWFDASDNLLIATENRGLCRLQSENDHTEANIQCINSSHGLFSDSLHQLQADQHGRLWISTNRGLFWLDQTELAAVFDGKQTRIRQTGTLNASSGMRNSELNGGAFPTGLSDRNGRLWWPSQSGLVVFDPAEQQNQASTLRARIDEIIVGTQHHRINQPQVELPRGDRSIQLALTAAAFNDPANIQFRFRIPALAPDWVETGRSRLIGPLNLPPGRIEIITQAQAGSTPWGEASTLQVQVPHYWYERRSVQALAITLLLGLIAWMVHRREQIRAQRSAELEQTIDQRTAELQQAQQQTQTALESVRRSAQQRTELFANIGHELRTPLTLISGPLEDAVQAGRTVDTQELDTMARSTRRMQRLVSQILDLRKTDDAAFALQKTAFELFPLMEKCCQPLAPLLHRRRLTLVLRSQLALARAMLDVDAFEKMLGNLISNAIKFSPSSRVITVELSGGMDQNVIITVLDQGPGVAKQEASHIFERFYRAQLSKERAIEGTGIGLSLARQLARLHDGDIRLVNPGKAGALFELQLPAIELLASDNAITLEIAQSELNAVAMDETNTDPSTADSTQTKPFEAESDNPNLNPTRAQVLVIEDDDSLREYIVSCLHDRYAVLEARDGQEGLNQARTHKPDLIVTDVMMPQMDGFMLVRELRDDERTSTIPILMLTALGAAGEVEGLTHGADDYLSKPFNREQLRARIHARLKDRERLLQALAKWRTTESEKHANESNEQGVATKKHRLIEKARNQIMQKLHDPDYTVARLANDLHVSRSQLHRALTEHDGRSPSQLLRELRLEAAAELLTQGFSVVEVAMATGFTGSSAFSRSFKTHFGCPPSQWK